MAVTQYIGARYVPLFFTNPTDQSNDWLSGVAYDPLTIVTYLNQSYTSKIPVPATVGNPADNPTYWILTGGYSAQVEQYRQEVEAYAQAASGNAADINTLYSLHDRQFILIGDSYGSGIDGNNNTQFVSGGGWANRAKAFIQAGGGTAYINTRSLGGMVGFASTLPFMTLFDAIIEDHVADPDKITDIVVLGGTNDVSVIGNVAAAVTAFITHAKAVCQHANIRIGALGSNAYNMMRIIKPNYLNACKYGAGYLAGLEPLLMNPDYIGADGVHLTETGYAHYAEIITNAIVSGNVNYSDGFNIPITLSTGVSGGTLTLYVTYSPAATEYDLIATGNPVNLPSVSTSGAASLEIGTLTKLCRFIQRDSNIGAFVAVKHISNSQTITDQSGFYLISSADNKLYASIPSALAPSASYDYIAFTPMRVSPVTYVNI